MSLNKELTTWLNKVDGRVRGALLQWFILRFPVKREKREEFTSIDFKEFKKETRLKSLEHYVAGYSRAYPLRALNTAEMP